MLLVKKELDILYEHLFLLVKKELDILYEHLFSIHNNNSQHVDKNGGTSKIFKLLLSKVLAVMKIKKNTYFNLLEI